MRRHLCWDGCFNARDLGGLRTSDGGEVRERALVRADALDALSAAGWDAVLAHGVRTIVDLRNDDERAPDAVARPSELTTLHLPLDGIEDREFWDHWSSGWQFGTPLYYGPHLARMPERSAAVIAAIARAGEGGVAFHCSLGRDRTGLVAMLLLHLLGVADQDIAHDYALSAERLPPLFAHRGLEDHAPHVDAHLAREGTTAPEILARTLRAFEREAWMRAGGVDDEILAALRDRCLR